MAEALGRSLYRGLLKGMARVWKPSEIHDSGLLEKIMTSMRSAEEQLGRLKAAQEKIGTEEFKDVLRTLNVKSPEKVENLATLERLVAALEQKAEIALSN